MRLTENQLRRIIRSVINESSRSEAAMNFHRGEMDIGTPGSCYEEGYQWCQDGYEVAEFEFDGWDQSEIAEFQNGYLDCEAEQEEEESFEDDYVSMEDRWGNDDGYGQNAHQDAISNFRRGERLR